MAWIAKMKLLVRIACVSAIAVLPVARIGAGDDEQIKLSLFDQVRDAIPKLKTGMSFNEVTRALMIKKLSEQGSYASLGASHDSFGFPGKSDQILCIDWHPSASGGLVYKVELYDGKRLIAQFDADKK
jgi:hypothetical protein